jgi:hypothetical protein
VFLEWAGCARCGAKEKAQVVTSRSFDQHQAMGFAFQDER